MRNPFLNVFAVVTEQKVIFFRSKMDRLSFPHISPPAQATKAPRPRGPKTLFATVKYPAIIDHPFRWK